MTGEVEFAGRCVLVTGGAGDIGWACARSLLAGGARVHLVDVDAARLAQAHAALVSQASGARVSAHVSALDTPAACREAYATAGEPVDTLIHMAGLFEPDPLDADERGVWQRAIASNLTTAYDMAIALRAQRPAERAGRIVLCSSRAFQRGLPGYAAYTAAKGGVVGLTRSFSREFAPDILVNAIAPGLIATRMTRHLVEQHGAQRLAEIPLRRLGTPEDIAGVARFLCSQASSYMTGQLLTVDGGTLNSS